MGLTVLEVEVGNPANPDVTEKLEFLIDSGAIYSVVPAPVLEGLGIKPLKEEEFRLVDGHQDHAPERDCPLQIPGKDRGGRCHLWRGGR